MVESQRGFIGDILSREESKGRIEKISNNMKVLVIPDVHLKPKMFTRAMAIMEYGAVERAVCLMDIADDWDQQSNIALYEETYDEAIRFAEAFPGTLWCYGNHDLSYIWDQWETGYSGIASDMVKMKLRELQSVLPAYNPIRYVQKIDNVLFSHGGVSDYFVRKHVHSADYNDVDAALDQINQQGIVEMWDDASPIWLRPQLRNTRMYKPRKLLQVVGHTPMEAITRNGNLISCDVFSRYQNGDSIGKNQFLLLDTLTWEYTGIAL